jgi:DNA invertase Pin-like site-specific DNA recombinase
MDNPENNNLMNPCAKIVLAKYKRCSTDNQELKLQDEILEKHIVRMREDNPDKEYEVLDFEDFAVSGKTIERLDFQKMMVLCDKKKINIILFTKLDRLARSLQDLLNTASVLDSKGVKFIAVEQNLETTTSQGKLLFHILGAFAEFERTIIRERMEAGRKRAELVGTKSGKPCHRPKIDIDEDGVKYKYKQGRSMYSISKEYKVSITPIRRILKQEIEDKQREEFEKMKEKFS